jgi:hypothetical protein
MPYREGGDHSIICRRQKTNELIAKGMTKNVIPAKAGIHLPPSKDPMDSRLRGNDEITDPRRRMNSLLR